MDSTGTNTNNHSSICVCTFAEVVGCDFRYSAPVTSYLLPQSNYTPIHDLPSVPIGMNLTLVRKLLQLDDLKWLLKQVQENGQKTDYCLS